MCFFFFNDTATTEIYTLSLHDALPIYPDPPFQYRLVNDERFFSAASHRAVCSSSGARRPSSDERSFWVGPPDRKSTRLNSSHDQISHAVFCLKQNAAQATPPPASAPPP